MTFRSQVAAHMALMVVSLIVLSGVALWGLDSQREDYSSAFAGYEDLRGLYEIGANVASARKLVYLDQPDARAVMRDIQAAAALLQSFAPRAAGPRMAALCANARQQLADAQTQLWEIITAGHSDVTAISRPLDRILRLISDISTEVRQTIQASEHAAHRKHQTVLYTSAGVCGALLVAAVGLGLWHYRTVMRPLRRLNRSVHELTQGRLDHRADTAGPEEFAQVARDFNTMADQLDGLYKSLEQQVADKSRQLVRSERLASVGFLAAGVAHEINNPIGIIAGHAELALQEMSRRPAEPALADARDAFTVIAEEAFRCKDIIEKLLSLARPGDEARKPLSLVTLVRSVIDSVAALQEHRQRGIRLDAPAGDELRVLACAGEIKQVALNLLINAIEATEAGTGRIDVSLRRDGDAIELTVADNGKGMTPEVLDRIFEPFFTTRRGAGRPGTGLGLSISHAIVAAHEGQIGAHSDGPGKGSRFVMRLPSAKSDTVVSGTAS
ncbi:MAG: HAMP domain-containing sensor histidine kinase [Tepidisphaeraceae bacterium]|jgi:signal transduction histidine kinase